MTNFQTSQTCLNLMRAFAGESQARNRYTFAASAAKAAKLHVIERVFTFTANQEKEHAEVFYGFLKELAGQTLHIDGGYPVDLYDDAAKLLRSARHNEYEEHGVVYPAFGDIARTEGFSLIADRFYSIAAIEQLHGQRFEYYLELVESGALFSSTPDTQWLCLNCGHVHTGPTAPMVCPVCTHDQGYFIRKSQLSM